MPQMAPTMWLLMLITLISIIVILKTLIYFWASFTSSSKTKTNLKTNKKLWLW